MALTETRPSTDGGSAVADSGTTTGSGAVERVIGSGDFLSIGRTFIVSSLVFGTIAGLGLAISGIDTAITNDLLGDTAGMVWSSSTLALVLAGVMPLLLGLAIYVIPLQVGSPAISFPRAAALALWSWLAGVLLFAASVALNGGVGGSDLDAARLGNLAVGLMMASLALGAVTVVTTVITHRQPGMSLARIPFFSWSMLIAAPIWIINLGAAFSGVILGQISGASAPGLAGNYVTSIAWLWTAPAVYMLAIPVLGIAVDIAAKAAGRRVEQYGAAQALIGIFGLLSFGAWAQTARSTDTIVYFGWVIAAGIPVLGLLGLVADTMRRSKINLSAAAIAAPLSLLLALGGVLAAAVQVIDTIGKGNLVGFEVGLLNVGQMFFLVGAAFTGAIGGLAFWSDKLWGESKDSLSKPAVGITFIGGGLLGTVATLQGVLSPNNTMGVEIYGGLIAAFGVVLALGIVSALGSALSAGAAGHEGPVDPDETGLTLEWAYGSPPASIDVDTKLPAINSPYPLLDLRDTGASDEESK
ncbi:MAG TPA: cbb3-type cytochrome c oxidase subunit I [Microthrixaceae bacterium]|nr:cbb3-type cytochrome c oxidase subunit I [Microthrixaceae bacterium]